MCAVRGTKLYGLRIKNSQSANNDKKNIFKGFNFNVKKVWVKFGKV